MAQPDSRRKRGPTLPIKCEQCGTESDILVQVTVKRGATRVQHSELWCPSHVVGFAIRQAPGFVI